MAGPCQPHRRLRLSIYPNRTCGAACSYATGNCMRPGFGELRSCLQLSATTPVPPIVGRSVSDHRPRAAGENAWWCAGSEPPSDEAPKAVATASIEVSSAQIIRLSWVDTFGRRGPSLPTRCSGSYRCCRCRDGRLVANPHAKPRSAVSALLADRHGRPAHRDRWPWRGRSDVQRSSGRPSGSRLAGRSGRDSSLGRARGW